MTDQPKTNDVRPGLYLFGVLLLLVAGIFGHWAGDKYRGGALGLEDSTDFNWAMASLISAPLLICAFILLAAGALASHGMPAKERETPASGSAETDG